MITKIWREKDYIDHFLYDVDCTQQYIEDNYYLIAETEDEVKDWFDNFSIDEQLFNVHSTRYLMGFRNVFVTPYWVKSLEEIKENPQIENRNNAICPVCDYIDFSSWEIHCPEESYTCPQCKSNLLLEHRFETDYDGDDRFYQRTTFKKLHEPPKVKSKEM